MTYFKCFFILVCVIYAKQYSSDANYSYINSLFTLDRPLKVSVSHFFKPFFINISIIGKYFMKRPVFLTSFKSFTKAAHFHKISEELVFILAIHVMLVLGKLWILYFPRPLKCCTYEFLSIRENRLEKISVSHECYHGLVLPPRLLYFELLIFLIKKSFTLWYMTGIFLVYRFCISVP